jgi:hypothetical protein
MADKCVHCGASKGVRTLYPYWLWFRKNNVDLKKRGKVRRKLCYDCWFIFSRSKLRLQKLIEACNTSGEFDFNNPEYWK